MSNALVWVQVPSSAVKMCIRDRYSPEMQNPDITKPAGAGDVPMANYKMIAALAVKRGELDRKELANFTKEHGLSLIHIFPYRIRYSAGSYGSRYCHSGIIRVCWRNEANR